MRRWFMLGCLPLLASCHQPVVELTEVLNYSSCQTLKAGAQWVEFAELARIRGAVMETPLDSPPQTFLAISNGTQPTPGYAFALDSFGARGSDLHLQLSWIEPADGSVQAQMLTSPCLVIGIETSAQLDSVVVTIDGEAFATADYPDLAAVADQGSSD